MASAHKKNWLVKTGPNGSWIIQNVINPLGPQPVFLSSTFSIPLITLNYLMELDVGVMASDEHILRRMVPAPGPVLVERVNDCKEVSTAQIEGSNSRRALWEMTVEYTCC